MHTAFSHSRWQMLVAVVLSQRATDEATIKVCKTLFSEVPTPSKVLDISIENLESILRPIGFFRQKAKAMQALALAVHTLHNDQVPITEKELLSLPQVGRKTANIILSMYSETPQLAVDIHVHRISNRMGWVRTTKPEQTEKAISPLLTKDELRVANAVLVQHGQHTCRPVSPKCSICPVASYCKRVGVTSSR